MRRTIVVSLAMLLLVSVAAIVIARSSTAGHTGLHIGCNHHDHGPSRTAGEGRRLLDARALARQGRPVDEAEH